MAKKILVIEDDPFLRKIINKKLISEGFKTEEAVTGAKGLEMAKRGVDLILLDLILPEMDGFEVLSKLKTDSQTSKIPIIIISNLGEADQIERGMKMGANDYMIKAHFTPGEIVERIQKFL